jgi:hypothetical protein
LIAVSKNTPPKLLLLDFEFYLDNNSFSWLIAEISASNES